jgi:hypothetical protein
MKSLHSLLVLAAIGGAGLYAACSKSTPEPEKTAASAQPARSNPLPFVHPPVQGVPSELTTGAAPAAPSGPDDIGWDAPKAWESVPNANSMRKATFKIPKAAGDTEDAELTVMAAGGGVDANIKRWSGQFGNAEPKKEQRSPNGLKVTVVEIKGTYASGGMMGGASTPKDKYMLLGAVVDAGDRQHFFKMTGPEKTVTAAKKDFDAFVASFRAK